MSTALTTALGSTLAYGPGWHHGGPGGPGWHDGAAGGPGWWILFPIAWFLLIVGAIVTAVLMRRRWHQESGRRAGEAVLAERLAAMRRFANRGLARLRTVQA